MESKMYKNRAYIIKTKTNLHVGADGTNFGIVDKEVQRDSISNLPIINGSSLKGAIREHFRDMLATTNELEIDSQKVKPFVFRTIFGEKQKELDEEDTKTYSKLPKHGLVKFIDAKLLFLPLRSNIRPFYHTTSISNLKSMVEFLKSFGISIEIDNISDIKRSVVIGDSEAIVEDVECKAHNIDISLIKELFGVENLAIFTDEDFNEAVSNLPIIARNKIATNADRTDGNLWYEEMIPRESILYTILCYYDNLDDDTVDRRGRTDRRKFENSYRLFDNKLLKDDIQIGANASIGYGICNFSILGVDDE